MADLVWSCFQGWAPVGSGGDQGCGDQESDCRVLTLKVVVSSDFREPGVVWGPLVISVVSRVYIHLPDLIRAMLLISVLCFFCTEMYQSTLGKLFLSSHLVKRTFQDPTPDTMIFWT